MKVIEHIEKAESPLISFEILPPLKGKSIRSLYKILDPLMEFNPPFINVTYHQAEYKYKLRANGFFEKVNISKRPGTVGICAAIKFRYKVDAVPHLICGGFIKEETENALVDLNYLGVHNVLALRGDPVSSVTSFKPEEGGHAYAIELVKQIVDLNKGVYLEEELTNGVKTDFCIGVAGYPEKHYEAANSKIDLRHLKSKVDAGADYIVTQMFFENQKYFDFVRACREAGITVPIIPGLKPLTRKRQLATIPRIFHSEIPEALADALQDAKDDAACVQIGTEWAIQQSKELIALGVPCLHFYTMGSVKVIQNIARAVI